MRARPAMIVLFALGLAGCITSDNPLALSTVASFTLTDVAVSFPPSAHLNYPHAEDQFAASKGITSGDIAAVDTLARSPEGVTFIRTQAAATMRDAFKREVGPTLRGAHPVRLDVAVTEIDVPGVARSVLLGGTATLVARVSLIDGASGQTLFTLPSQAEYVQRGGGLIGTAVQSAMESAQSTGEPYQLLCEKLAQDYAAWLFKERSGA